MTLNRILGVSLSDSSWLKAQIPVTCGGLGIRSTLKHYSAAFLASVSSSRNILKDLAPSVNFASVSNVESREHVSAVLKMEETIPDKAVGGLSQRELAIMIDSHLQNCLLDSAATPREKARFLSVQLLHAGDWLQVIPSTELCLQLRDAEKDFCFVQIRGTTVQKCGGVSGMWSSR